jgi:hypothetical protein
MKKIVRLYKSIIIKNGHLKAVYERNEPCEGSSVITYENQTPVHNDMIKSMQHLATHVRNISGLSIIQKLFVLGYIKVNSGDAQLITIFSRVGEDCENNDIKGVSSLESRVYIGKGNYYDENGLAEAIKLVENEADAYIDRGKNFEGDCAYVFDNEDLLNS